MALYLLDTDAAIDYLNKIPGSVRLIDRLQSRGETLCTCALVVAEVYAGLTPSEVDRGRIFLNSLDFFLTTRNAAERAGNWRYIYARQGTQISIQDALIAATAHENDATVVTGNVRHFPMPEVSLLPLPR